MEIKYKNRNRLWDEKKVIWRWREYHKELLNVGKREHTVISCSGIQGGVINYYEESQISKKKYGVNAIRRLEMAKLLRMDGFIDEMINYKSEIIKRWTIRVSRLAWWESAGKSV